VIRRRRDRPLVLRSPGGAPRRRAPRVARLIREIRELKRAVHLRDEFLSMASHELNTPLATLTLVLEEMVHPPAGGAIDPPTMTKMLGLAERQARRLSRLVGDLLDSTRIHRNTLALRLERVDLARIVREVVKGFESRFVAARCEPRLDIGAPVFGQWDPARIEQVLLNLLSNAVKFGAGSPIEIRVDQAGEAARLAVTDHGTGIDPTRGARLFERFERGVTAQHYGGLGLGLYICRHIVESHGGSISFDSRPGHGTTFLVTLPCAGPVEPQR